MSSRHPFGEVTSNQQALLDVIWDVYDAEQRWPLFEYVQWRLEQLGLNAYDIIAWDCRVSR